MTRVTILSRFASTDSCLAFPDRITGAQAELTYGKVFRMPDANDATDALAGASFAVSRSGQSIGKP